MENKETKKCPYCGEEILAVARKCKYCKQWIIEESDSQSEIQCQKDAEKIPSTEGINDTSISYAVSSEEPISTYHPPIINEQPEAINEEPEKTFSYLWWILGATIIILAGIIIFTQLGPSMSDAKKKMRAGDIDGAVSELIELAEEENDEAIDALVDYCFEIENTPKVSLSKESRRAALPWLEQRAENWENGDLAELISDYYFYCDDENGRMKWVNLGAKKGNIRCAYLLGLKYKEDGEYDKSIPYLIKGTEDDFGYAYYNLAQIFLDPKYHNFDETKGVEYLIKAADNECKDAMLDVAIRYATGKGLPEDIDKALEYFEASGSYNEQWKEYIRNKYKTKHGLEYYFFSNE